MEGLVNRLQTLIMNIFQIRRVDNKALRPIFSILLREGL
jgi:hypothetical protein